GGGGCRDRSSPGGGGKGGSAGRRACLGRARQSRRQSRPSRELSGAGAASIPTWWLDHIGPPRRREQGSRASRGERRRQRHAAHSRGCAPTIGAVKTPRDAVAPQSYGVRFSTALSGLGLRRLQSALGRLIF